MPESRVRHLEWMDPNHCHMMSHLREIETEKYIYNSCRLSLVDRVPILVLDGNRDCNLHTLFPDTHHNDIWLRLILRVWACSRCMSLLWHVEKVFSRFSAPKALYASIEYQFRYGVNGVEYAWRLDNSLTNKNWESIAVSKLSTCLCTCVCSFQSYIRPITRMGDFWLFVGPKNILFRYAHGEEREDIWSIVSIVST